MKNKELNNLCSLHGGKYMNKVVFKSSVLLFFLSILLIVNGCIKDITNASNTSDTSNNFFIVITGENIPEEDFLHFKSLAHLVNESFPIEMIIESIEVKLESFETLRDLSMYGLSLVFIEATMQQVEEDRRTLSDILALSALVFDGRITYDEAIEVATMDYEYSLGIVIDDDTGNILVLKVHCKLCANPIGSYTSMRFHQIMGFL